MWSHLSLALTMISAFVFLLILSSQPHLFFLLKARQEFLSVTVLDAVASRNPEDASQEAWLICTSEAACAHSMHFAASGLFLDALLQCV